MRKTILFILIPAFIVVIFGYYFTLIYNIDIAWHQSSSPYSPPSELAIYFSYLSQFIPYIILSIGYTFITAKVVRKDEQDLSSLFSSYALNQGILFLIFSILIFLSAPASSFIKTYHFPQGERSVKIIFSQVFIIGTMLGILLTAVGLYFKNVFLPRGQSRPSKNVAQTFESESSCRERVETGFFGISKSIIIALMEKLEIFLFLRMLKEAFKPFSIIQQFLISGEPKFNEIILLYFSSVTLLNGYLLSINKLWHKYGYNADIINVSLAKDSLSVLLFLTLISFLALLLVMALPKKLYEPYGKVKVFSVTVLYNVYITIYLAVIMSIFPVLSILTKGNGNFVVNILLAGLLASQIYLYRVHLKIGWLSIFVLAMLGGYLHLQVVHIKNLIFT